MKTKLSIVLGCLLCCPALAQTNQPQSRIEPQITAPCMILVVIAVTAAVGYAVLKVASLCPDQTSPVTLVLEKSNDHSTWTPVYTNTVVLNGTNRLDFFTFQMTDPCAFYRARVKR